MVSSGLVALLLSHWLLSPGSVLFVVVLHLLENVWRQSRLSCAHKVLILVITTGAFVALLPPSPLPKDCITVLSTEQGDGEEDGELLEPLLGDKVK